MATEVEYFVPTGGFNFENCLRNSYFESKGFPLPKAKKTGTTIVGIIYKDGVILGADTRATVGNIIADKNSEKIHYLAPNMYCCGAGTAADTEKVTDMIAAQLKLHRLATDRAVPVCVANRLLKQYLYRYQGHIGAALILGGVDSSGPSLYTIHPHGSSSCSHYSTMGSGSLAAMSVFEKRFKPGMSLEEGQKLIRDAICGGIFNDMGSGSTVDMCVITKEGRKYIRPYEIASLKGKLLGSYGYKRGATAILTSQVIPLEVESVVVKRSEDDEEMDISG